MQLYTWGVVALVGVRAWNAEAGDVNDGSYNRPYSVTSGSYDAILLVSTVQNTERFGLFQQIGSRYNFTDLYIFYIGPYEGFGLKGV